MAIDAVHTYYLLKAACNTQNIRERLQVALGFHYICRAVQTGHPGRTAERASPQEILGLLDEACFDDLYVKVSLDQWLIFLECLRLTCDRSELDVTMTTFCCRYQNWSMKHTTFWKCKQQST